MSDAARLTDLDEAGRARMVDVGGKEVTERVAVAEGTIELEPATAALLAGGNLPKGDALGVARVAAIGAVKETPRLIPLAHPLRVTAIRVDFDVCAAGVRVEVEVKASDRTGVEMEALTGAAIACLTLYDMVKGVQRGARITGLRLVAKRGGRSGDWRAEP